MKAMAWLAAGFAALALLTGTAQAADKKNSELIVGKWTPGDKKEVVIEFSKGGEVKITIGEGGKGVTMSGKYKIVEEKTVEVTIAEPNSKEEKTHKLTIKSITADEMTIINPEGKEEKLKAVK